MKQIKFILTFIAIVLSCSAQAQWQKVYQKSENVVIYNIGENILLPCKTGGLVMSMDNGKSWDQVSSIAELKDMNKLTISDSGLFISSNHNIYKSIDSGKSWQILNKWPYGYLYSQISASGHYLLGASGNYRVVVSKDL